MRSISKKLTLLASAAGSLLHSSAAYSQERPSEANDAGDIVVTARRTEERLQDVPISITVFNQQQLTNRNVVSAGDIATYTPSLTSNARFGSNNTSFAIRGFVQEGATSPSVAVYFADVTALRSNGSTTSGNGAGPGAFFDLQNVQVLKGPQGTLFGRNTTGGAVLLVPQKPTSNFEGYVEGSIGNYDMRRFQAVVNAPLGQNVRLRLGIDRQVRDGFLRNISPVGPKDFDDVNYWSARASLVIDITPDLENYTIATFSDSDTNGAYPKIYSAPGNNPLVVAQLAATRGRFYDIMNGNPYAEAKSRQWQAINTTTWQASDTITLKNILSYGQVRAKQSSNLFGEYTYPSGTPPIYNYFVAPVSAPGKYNVSQSTFTEELQLQGRTDDGRLTYQFGAYLESSKPLNGFQETNAPIFLSCSDINAYQCVDLAGRNIVVAPGVTLEGRVGSLANAITKYSFRNLGIYGQATYKLTEALSLTGGIRYTSDRTSGLGRPLKIFFPAANTPVYTCTNPPPITQGGTSAQIQADKSRCDFAATSKSNKPTWLIGLDYKPSEDVLVYAKYARGYRQGSVNIASYGLESWLPEKVDTYEIGAKLGFSGAVSGYFNIAAFYNDFTNQQLQFNTTACTAADLISRPAQCPFPANPSAGIGNAGKSTIKGVELEALIRPVEGLTLEAGYAYLDTKLKSIVAPAVPVGFTAITPTSLVGGPLTLTPKHKVTLNANYSLPLGDDVGTISIGANYSHQSKYYNTATAPVGFRTLGAQDNLNLNLNWNSVGGLPLDLGAFVTNVTKERYYLVTLGSTNNFGFDAAVLNQPRMYGLRLKYRFGE